MLTGVALVEVTDIVTWGAAAPAATTLPLDELHESGRQVERDQGTRLGVGAGDVVAR